MLTLSLILLVIVESFVSLLQPVLTYVGAMKNRGSGRRFNPFMSKSLTGCRSASSGNNRYYLCVRLLMDVTGHLVAAGTFMSCPRIDVTAPVAAVGDISLCPRMDVTSHQAAVSNTSLCPRLRMDVTHIKRQ